MRTEKRYVRPNGRTVWAHVSSSLVTDADGAPVHLVSQIEDVTDRKRAETKLRDLAEHDSLTGLLNRRAFLDQGDSEWVRHKRHRHPLACVAMDVDAFKHINDNFGHAAGDAVLQHIGTLLRATLRASDLPARTGGDEFVALMPETTTEGAGATAEREKLAPIEEPFLSRLVGLLFLFPFLAGDADGLLIFRVPWISLILLQQHGRARNLVFGLNP